MFERLRGGSRESSGVATRATSTEAAPVLPGTPVPAGKLSTAGSLAVVDLYAGGRGLASEYADRLESTPQPRALAELSKRVAKIAVPASQERPQLTDKELTTLLGEDVRGALDHHLRRAAYSADLLELASKANDPLFESQARAVDEILQQRAEGAAQMRADLKTLVDGERHTLPFAVAGKGFAYPPLGEMAAGRKLDEHLETLAKLAKEHSDREKLSANVEVGVSGLIDAAERAHAEQPNRRELDQAFVDQIVSRDLPATFQSLGKAFSDSGHFDPLQYERALYEPLLQVAAVARLAKEALKYTDPGTRRATALEALVTTTSSILEAHQALPQLRLEAPRKLNLFRDPIQMPSYRKLISTRTYGELTSFETKSILQSWATAMKGSIDQLPLESSRDENRARVSALAPEAAAAVDPHEVIDDLAKLRARAKLPEASARQLAEAVAIAERILSQASSNIWDPSFVPQVRHDAAEVTRQAQAASALYQRFVDAGSPREGLEVLNRHAEQLLDLARASDEQLQAATAAPSGPDQALEDLRREASETTAFLHSKVTAVRGEEEF